MEEASEQHITVELIDRSCIVELEGQPPILYLQEEHSSLDELPMLINKISLGASSRSANIGQESILFGAINRLISKGNYCTQGALLSKDSYLDNLLTSKFAFAFDSIMNEFLPERHKVGAIRINGQQILPEYRMAETNFTSGIINKNSAFKYHYDKFNLANTYSSMIVFKKDVLGGHLVIPEYGIGFKLSNHAIIQFYGKGILHGVTPIIEGSQEAHRISVVYYASQKLGECKTFEEELKKAQNI